jgi:hypothetical protein
MQTFLPYIDYHQSARSLDRQRLGKQRVECLQILKALHDPNYGWQNHPAVKMWRGHEQSLVEYSRAVCIEWLKRGYKDTCLDKIAAFAEACVVIHKPPWLTHELCRTHQSNLKRKDPTHYGAIFPDVPDDLEYLWPV